MPSRIPVGLKKGSYQNPTWSAIPPSSGTGQNSEIGFGGKTLGFEAFLGRLDSICDLTVTSLTHNCNQVLNRYNNIKRDNICENAYQ